jgi:hypothetical protein
MILGVESKIDTERLLKRKQVHASQMTDVAKENV